MPKNVLLTLDPTHGEHKPAGFPRWRFRWQMSLELLIPPVTPVAALADTNLKTL